MVVEEEDEESGQLHHLSEKVISSKTLKIKLVQMLDKSCHSLHHPLQQQHRLLMSIIDSDLHLFLEMIIIIDD
jgi:hypothetical protein